MGGQKSAKLIEGHDYLIDSSGQLVFTARFLLSRGECCGNKCRNCPFNWVNVPPGRKRVGEPSPPIDKL